MGMIDEAQKLLEEAEALKKLGARQEPAVSDASKIANDVRIASGPDGIPNEFLQTYWPIVRDEIMQIVDGFYNNSIDLTTVNRANLVLVPKKEVAKTVGDFRPISIINIVPKLLSKLLANRLREKLADLVHVNQTAFIKGRQITDNFVATREVLQHISGSTNQAIFLKIDFAKAFDSIEWDFIYKVLEARGFPDKWITWIKVLFGSASSRVLINGGMTEFFAHKRGLRQGDPLSPMLFNLAADVFQRMVLVINQTSTDRISRKVKQAVMAFQYADDTAVIASASKTALVSLKVVIRLFAAISGLRVNYDKSSFVPINVGGSDLPWIEAVLGCAKGSFPVTYLGMPLTVTKPTRNLFMPLIERVERKLGGWKGKFISKGGRLQLVQSVLSSVPVYFMMCFRLPQWVIGAIDKIRRRFLWGKSDHNARSISLINWPTTCMPRTNGGLGVTNLNFQNIALLLRWWWKPYHEPDSLWSKTVTTIRNKRQGQLQQSRIWIRSGSFFWNMLLSIHRLFLWSISWQIGDGTSISFWYDTWNGRPLASFRGRDQIVQHPNIALRDAWQRLEVLQRAGIQGLHMAFNPERDMVRWNWSQNGIYFYVCCGTSGSAGMR